jgi:bla regulator protein blaR1
MTDWLFDTVIATTALLLLILLVRGSVARHFGPSVAYWLWLLPAARAVMPTLTEEIAAPVAPIANTIAGSILNAAADPASQSAITAAQTSFNWLGLGLSIWLGGAALLFIAQMVRYCALRDELLADATEIDRIGNIRVIQSDRIGGPLAFGLFRRFIAVPDHFTRTFAPEERDLALAHELAHHRAGDLYANLAAFIFLCLSWFNPLAWMAWSAFRFDQEAACDARVLAGTDTGTRQQYGRALARAASSDRMPALAMAMAQNSPRNIIERLRRLMMKDTSKRRLWAGRAAIFAAAAIALPLTATVVPVFADDQPAANSEEGKTKKIKTKIVMIKGGDGKAHRIDISGDEDTPFVRTIKKDGKTIVLHSTHELSEAEVEKMVADAEASRGQAEADLGQAEAARSDAEAARGEAEAHRAHAMAIVSNMDIESYIPEIDIREVTKNCEEGQPVTTDVSGFDGKNKSRVRLVMCGKGQAKLARVHAIAGLREAKAEVEADEDIPNNVRQSVLDSMERQIKRMQDQLSNDEKPEDEN